MGYGCFCYLWVWCRRTNRRPCCPPMSNPSTSPWTAWLDGSRRWDNRLAAQHLSRDLLRPRIRSKYEERFALNTTSLKQMKQNKLWYWPKLSTIDGNKMLQVCIKIVWGFRGKVQITTKEEMKESHLIHLETYPRNYSTLQNSQLTRNH